MSSPIKSSSYAAVGALVLAAGLSAVPEANAQSSGAEAYLDEVTVTARRREESLQEVPLRKATN